MNNSKEFDWQDVELKVSLICYKFDNLKPWHDDLAQELRIHAYYISNNYYDLYRKAIDFWRKLQTQQSPEVPYFDLELLQNPNGIAHDSYLEYDNIIALIKKELDRPSHGKWDSDMLNLAKQLLEIITEDVDPRLKSKRHLGMNKSDMNHYFNHRLNLSWVSEETGIGYKRLVAAMKFLEDTVRGLAAMHKIEIPPEYFEGYYD